MFIGRDQEILQLRSVLDNTSASLIVIKGRRRIGKSRLITEFCKSFKHYVFMGLSPRPGITAQDQRNEFVRQFKEQFSLPGIAASDWGDIFTLLAKQNTKGRIIVVFDEISWMASGDLDFLGKLKIAWDLHFSKNPKLVLILCGSISAWIDKNILSSTGYLGRPSLHMTINDLPLEDCNKFWHKKTKFISVFEKLKILAITGGVPRYLELINLKETAEQNICRLCFNKNSPLYDEFKYIFSDIYGKRSDKYQAIVQLLAKSKANREDIIKKVGLPNSGDTTEYLDDLEVGGFIEKELTWSTKSKQFSKLSLYRLKDNYTRFYLKYILPNKTKIEKGQFNNISINNLPGWNSILALQFENLVLNNHNKITSLLGIKSEDIIIANPFFQRTTTRQQGCQIDYMIQTKHDTVYICKIKFSRQEISKEIIPEVKSKMSQVNLPKYISRRAVLIHVNGVQEAVLEEGFFCYVIDFGQFL